MLIFQDCVNGNTDDSHLLFHCFLVLHPQWQYIGSVHCKQSTNDDLVAGVTLIAWGFSCRKDSPYWMFLASVTIFGLGRIIGDL